MGTKYMLLGIALILCGILFAIMPHPMLYIPPAGGLLLAVAGFYKEG